MERSGIKKRGRSDGHLSKDDLLHDEGYSKTKVNYHLFGYFCF